MKIAVIGAGIIGTTTALELIKDGHEVSVFERRSAVAEESSFANAGITSCAIATPWSSPGMPFRMATQIFNRHAPARIGFPLTGDALGWMWKFARASKANAYSTNRDRMLSLAEYSQKRRSELCKDFQPEYENNSASMVLFRSKKDFSLFQPVLEGFRSGGIAFQELTQDACASLEPALNPETPFHRAIYVPGEGAGNCRQFAILLKNEALRLGARFEFNTSVLGIDTSSGVALSLSNSDLKRQFDLVVLCTGIGSTTLLRSIGLKLPLTPVYGYSISAAIKEPINAPQTAVMDERYKVAICRFGNRIRVSGVAEIGGDPAKNRNSSIKTLYKVLQDWFPGAANHSSGAQVWKGARPMTPNGSPVLGKSHIPGLWLNFGHGSTGWAMSCGSARVIADLINGQEPAIDVQRFCAAPRFSNTMIQSPWLQS
jgi:D-amino-acid dehydrogenase